MPPIRIAAVGLGNRLRSLSSVVKKVAGLEVAALCDTRPERIEATREALGADIPGSQDYAEVLAMPGVDAVLLATPNDQHADQVIDALAAGKHVLVEKPMASSVVDAARMVEAVDASDRVMMVGLQMRYHPWVEKFKQLVAAGRIGTPRMTWCTEWRGPFARSKDWVFDQAHSGGAIVEKNCHHFDLFNWWADSRPARVAAFGGVGPCPALVEREMNIVDHAYIIAELENDVRAMVGVCFFGSEGVGRDMGITGDEGTLLQSRRDDKTTHTFYPREGEWEPVDIPDGTGNIRIVEAFRDAILGDAEASPNARDGYESILAPAAAEIAIREKRVVTIEEIEAEL